MLAACGDVATMEALAAAAILREKVPDLKLRFVNVVDLFKLQPSLSIRTGRPSASSTACSPTDKPIIFNFHGYPWLIHRLAYRFKGHENLHVRGYKEKGNINTPLELAMLNETSRFHLVIDFIDRVPKLRDSGRAPQGGDEERDHRQHALRARARHGSARDRQLDLAVLMDRPMRATEAAAAHDRCRPHRRRGDGPTVRQHHPHACRWTPCRRRTPAIPARRWRWRRWPTACGSASCASTPAHPIWPNRDRFVLSAATPRCCSTRCCT